MPAGLNRRRFLGNTATLTAAAAASSLFSAPAILASRSPNSKLNIAGIGVGGRGGSHVDASLSQNLVAVCDTVDDAVAGCLRRAERYNKDHNLDRPLPATFSDYRQMLDKMHDRIDAVFVATPDHQHAPAAMMAIKLGKHVYCEKPLTYTIDEARKLTLAAREHKVATQMGNQGRATDQWRKLCEMIWDGAIGEVQEVHAWTDRPGIPSHFWWPQGGSKPAGSDPVPAGLNWDAWLGPAPQRPYLESYREGPFEGRRVYQPFVWRGWWEFGTGALGDIGCHSLSGIYTALKIEKAAAVELVKDSGDTTADMYPASSIIRWHIPARSEMPPCVLYWYDGGYYPPREVAELSADQQYPSNGMIVIGTKGKLACYGDPQLMSAERRRAYRMPEPTIPRCESDHFQEWVAACQGARPAFSNFDHAGPLTEFVLLGNLAIRAGAHQRVEWDAAAMQCTNRPELNAFVARQYRSGWEL